MHRLFRTSSRGFTFVELVVATAVMMILASAALPIVRVSVRRQKEAELRYTLREVRKAIDQFKQMADVGQLAAHELTFGAENYPSSLDQLVEGVTYANDASGRKKKFLRRVPIDPVTGTTEWGLRSYTDKPDALVWGGTSVFDIYSKAAGKGLNGIKYRDW
jgi:general secretion pathway protein G